MELLKKYTPIILFIVSLAWALRALFLSGYPDFQVQYYGAMHLINHENPYQSDERYFTPQVYPPFDMVFFIPLLIFPYEIAMKVWIVVSVFAVLMSILLINRMYAIAFLSPLSLFLSALVFIAFPTKFTFGMGQINAVILLFTVLVWYYFNKKKYFKSGIYFAFPVMLKFFPLLFAPYFLLLKKWKLLFSFFATVGVHILLSLYFVPFEIQYMFFSSILPELLGSWKGDYYNQSITGVLMRSTSDESLRQMLRLLIPLLFMVVTFAIILWKRQKSTIRINLEISLLLIVSILINNFSWQHHFIQLLLPFFILAYSIKIVFKNQFLYIYLAVSYALIAINLVNPNTVPTILQSHVFFGGFLLYVVNYYLLIKLQK